MMSGATEERWRKLAEQAQAEKDPEKLILLVEEINRLLGAKEEALPTEHQAAA
jgi:hypothetical protein